MNDNNSNKSSDAPSEEEIFEYFLGRATPESSRLISAYLKANPQTERELREWALIEQGYEKFPLQSPNELVLNRVRNMARAQAPNAASTTSFFARFKTRFSTRELALALTLVVAVFANHTMRQMRSPAAEKSATNAGTTAGNSDKTLLASRTESVLEPVAIANTMTDADQIIQALSDYDMVVDSYQAGHFQEASNGFSDIVSMRPNFEKRRELYTYWVETLKKLGKYALAEKKQKILEDIVAEESNPH